MILLLLIFIFTSLSGMELPSNLKRQPTAILNAHGAPITETIVPLTYGKEYPQIGNIALSSKEKKLVAGVDGAYYKFNLYLGSLANGNLHKIGTMPAEVCDVAFNKDDSIICAANGNGSIYLWNINNDNHSLLSCMNEGSCLSLEPHPQQNNLLFGGYKKGMVKLWDINQQSESTKINLYQDKSQNIRDLRYKHELATLAIRNENSVYLWDIRTKQANQLGKDYKGNYGTLSWNPTNLYELAIPHDNRVEIIDIRTQNILQHIAFKPYAWFETITFITSSLLLIHSDHCNHVYDRTTKNLIEWSYAAYDRNNSFHNMRKCQTFLNTSAKKYIAYLYLYDFSNLIDQNNIQTIASEPAIVEPAPATIPLHAEPVIDEATECPICFETYDTEENNVQIKLVCQTCKQSICNKCKIKIALCPFCRKSIN